MVIAMKGASFHLGVSKTKDFTPTIFTVHIKLKHHNMFIFSDQGGIKESVRFFEEKEIDVSKLHDNAYKQFWKSERYSK